MNTSQRWAKPTSRSASRRGAATVEMAMVLPVILALVFGSIEFTRLMMVRQGLTNAARAAARHACLATTRNFSQAVEVAQSESLAVLNSTEHLVITVTPAFSAAPAHGTPITVNMEIDCADASWFPPSFTGEVTLSSTCTMIRE